MGSQRHRHATNYTDSVAGDFDNKTEMLNSGLKPDMYLGVYGAFGFGQVWLGFLNKIVLRPWYTLVGNFSVKKY